MTKKTRLLALVFLLIPLAGSHCDRGVLFKTITATDLADPTSIVVDTAKLRAYIVNSNNSLKFTTTQLSILDLTNPAAPVLLNNAANPIAMPNFSGQGFLDSASGLLYMTNRNATDRTMTAGALLRMNVDEASANLGKTDSFVADNNPFGLGCCDPQGRLYTVNAGNSDFVGTVDVFNPTDLSSHISLSLNVTTSNGTNLSGRESTEIALLGNQAFVTNRGGNLYVFNTPEVGNTATNPLDYVVINGGDYLGIATDGTLLYVVDTKHDSNNGLPAVRILNPALMPPINPDQNVIAELDISTVQTGQITLDDKADINEIVVFKGKAYVTDKEHDQVDVIDLASQTYSTFIKVGDQPFAMAAFTIGSTDYLYVSNLGDDSISIIDLGTNTVIGTYAP